MSKQRSVWVLVRHHNDYNQYGEYFVDVFDEKPTVRTLVKYWREHMSAEYYPSQGDEIAALEFFLHLEGGGGRRDNEDVWFEVLGPRKPVS